MIIDQKVVTSTVRDAVRTTLSNTARKPQAAQMPIVIASSRRSGSTMLMEACASQWRYSFSDQPLSVLSVPRVFSKYLPLQADGQLTTPSPETQGPLLDYFSALAACELQVNGPWNFIRRPDQLFPVRTVIKLVDGKLALGWLNSQVRIAGIVLLRHPLTQAHSVMRNGWGLIGAGIASSAHAGRLGISEEALSYYSSTHARLSPLALHVADWCLENVPLLAIAKRENFTVISYEHLVLEEQSVAEHLCERFDLPSCEKFVKSMQRASRSSSHSSDSRRQAIGARRASDLLRLPEIDAARVSECEEVLSVFGVDTYSCGDPLPQTSALAPPATSENIVDSL